MASSSHRHRDRLAMGAGAVLTVAEAAALLPVADADARRWLHGAGLVRRLAGRAVVVWADVHDALRSSDGPEAPRAEAAAPALRRVKLPTP